MKNNRKYDTVLGSDALVRSLMYYIKRKGSTIMDYGLIGEKLGHSLSKPIHESLADYTYDIHPLTREEFTTFMEQKTFQAINVTIPYKKDVIPYLDSMDDNAKAIGAVNTIVNNNGKLKGYNTDFSGFDYMVERHGVELKNKKVVVLGNGGAAQAIKAVVQKHEAKEMIVVDVVDDGESITYEECFAKHNDADVIINTSPIGMYPKVDASPVDLTRFPNCHAVMDVVYNPITTKLVAQARELGMIGVTGLEMLVAQAKYAVEIFLDVEIEDARINEIYEEIKKDFL